MPEREALAPDTQADAVKLMKFIHMEAKDSLNGCIPFRLSELLLSKKRHHLVKLRGIPADDVISEPLFSKYERIDKRESTAAFTCF